MVRYTVIGGNSSQDLARRLAGRLKAGYIGAGLRVFPDGEQKITLSAPPPKSGTAAVVVVVQSTGPPVDSNLVQALSLIHKAGEAGPKVFAVIPYMGYARQDREFLPGEVVTAGVVAESLRAAGASRVFVVDIHSRTALKRFKTAGKNVSAVPSLVKHLKRRGLKDPLVVSPDAGGAERARRFAAELGSESVALEKRRDRRTGGVKIVSARLDGVKGRDVVLVDDMISTGGSIIKAAGFLRGQRCKRIFVACTHALLIDGAEKKIRRAGVAEIISTNTVPGATSVVDVSEPIAEAIRDAGRVRRRTGG